MFKKQKPTPSYVLRLDAIERNQWSLHQEIESIRQKVNLIRMVESDLKKVDVLTVMMSELARRVDMAGVPELPDNCKCETCGCDSTITFPRLESIDDVDAYCVKCKDKRKMVDAVIKTSDSGRRMATGKCPVCSTKVNRILGKVQESWY